MKSAGLASHLTPQSRKPSNGYREAAGCPSVDRPYCVELAKEGSLRTCFSLCSVPVEGL